MHFSAKHRALSEQPTACLIIGLFEQQTLKESCTNLPDSTLIHIQNIIDQGDITGKQGQTALLYGVPGIAAKRVLLIGLGNSEELDGKNFSQAIEKALSELKRISVRKACLSWPNLADCPVSDYEASRNTALAAMSSRYRPDRCKSKPEDKGKPLKKLQLLLNQAQPVSLCNKGLEHGKAVGAGMNLARKLADLPGNICTPSYLARKARKLAKKSDRLKAWALNEKQMRKLGMGALLSVSRGSRQPARLIVMEYQGAGNDSRPVVLVGKGLTFDAGGISIKPSASMDEMKYDMCGGASVFGVIQACIQLELPINVVGIVPSSENLPDGAANKPGDIVTSMAGLTIEILNTDAEGRLILCDALTYAKRFDPAAVVDIATLTGACVVALGHHISGLLGNSDELAAELETAGKAIDDPVWRLPMTADYEKQLNSNFADLANIGGRSAGTITAACFLSRFTKDYDWAHLDIAGTAWKSGNDKGATGRPVALLTQMLLQRCNQAE